MDSIGAILRQERENRGLSLPEAHDATKITVQNLAALEEDRFDNFPNRVYARAFLRDYANYLGLDSAALLEQYEHAWNPRTESDPAPAPRGGSIWRPIAYIFLILIIAGGVAAGGYFGWRATSHIRHHRAHRVTSASVKSDSDVATIPKAPPVAPPKPEADNASATNPQPQPAPQKLTLDVGAVGTVWVRVICDGGKATDITMTNGMVKSFEANKSIYIRAGKAGAVQLRLNGQSQPSLGPLGQPGEKTFTLPPAAASTTTAAPASNSAATPAASSAPAGSTR